jgi:hypothetical protein
VLDDYPYAGINFRGDPDMPPPLGADYGDIGNKFLNISIFFVFLYLGNKNIFERCLNIN